MESVDFIDESVLEAALNTAHRAVEKAHLIAAAHAEKKGSVQWETYAKRIWTMAQELEILHRLSEPSVPLK